MLTISWPCFPQSNSNQKTNQEILIPLLMLSQAKVLYNSTTDFLLQSLCQPMTSFQDSISLMIKITIPHKARIHNSDLSTLLTLWFWSRNFNRIKGAKTKILMVIIRIHWMKRNTFLFKNQAVWNNLFSKISRQPFRHRLIPCQDSTLSNVMMRMIPLQKL